MSEGQRQKVLDRLSRAATSVPGVRLLDLSADPDHNRSVFTLVGEAANLQPSLLNLYQVALEEIDLCRHRGVHPRLGAVDVVPFVPLGESAMVDAVAAARALGEEVGKRFQLPVYLYEEAATRSERRSLAAIRQGSFEGLATRLRDPQWAPDYGPATVHPTAGATVIGARFFLIAFNLLLATRDLTVAKRIAQAIRESSGGLPAVRAIGVYLESRGCTQVSMNLVDFRRTSLATVVARVRQEAQALGTEVTGSEIVGLVPEEALLDALRQCLLAPNLDAGRILEHRLREA